MVSFEDIATIKKALEPHVRVRIMRDIEKAVAEFPASPGIQQQAVGVMLAVVGNLIAESINQDQNPITAAAAHDPNTDVDGTAKMGDHEFAMMSLTGRGLSRDRLQAIRMAAQRGNQPAIVHRADEALSELEADQRGDKILERVFARP